MIKKFEEFENTNESLRVGNFNPKVKGGYRYTKNPFGYNLALDLPNPVGENLIVTDDFELNIMLNVPGVLTEDFEDKVRRRIEELEDAIRQEGIKYQQKIQQLTDKAIKDLEKLDDPKLKNDPQYQEILKNSNDARRKGGY